VKKLTDEMQFREGISKIKILNEYIENMVNVHL
jgi:hypothetical protein